MSNDKIQSVLGETRVFHPDAGFTAKARVTPAKLAELRAAAEKDSVAFWAGLARQELAWKKPFTVTLDDRKAPNYGWFTDGTLNVS
ncbi:acetyl-coenzyme A synthetase N-terminal domain-containing protein, partial [Micromonospora sp. AMSO31t]|uniref:acetyl-coenzyme A synthetase N-terminal domain-containing protein n=1 Tax=Micromonospora sp. AMSO31t TaxID=2650566 RepID=UPI001323C453